MARKLNFIKIAEPKQETTDPTDMKGVLDLLKAQREQEKEELKSYTKQLVEELKPEVKQDIQDFVSQNQTRIIEALAIFVALFTFISINIQVFNKTQDLRSAAIFMVLMAILTTSLISFPLILLHSNKGDAKPAWLWWVFASSIIFLVAILFLSNWFNIPLNIIQASR